VNSSDIGDGPGEVTERLNLLLLQIVDLQERISQSMEVLENEGQIPPQLENHVRQVLSDISLWVDECTKVAEDRPILLRRIEVHVERLRRLEELIRAEDL
jgi:hypothetical protein